MADQRLRIELEGGGPWGFRLQGGLDGQPVTVSKLRRRSKANLSDLREGDILVATNGIPIQGKSHSQAMDIIDEAGNNLTLDIIRPADGVSHQSSTETRTYGDTVSTIRTDTVTEQRPDGYSTTTTVTREHSYGHKMEDSVPSSPLPFTQVQNQTPKPFTPSSGPSVLDTGLNLDGSISMTIGDTKENVPPKFNVRQIASDAGSVQDPQDEYMDPNQAAYAYMESPSVSYDGDESGFGVAVPKVMPATPGLPPVDIQKLLEPADDEPPDTPTHRNLRKKVYADSAFFDDPESKYPTIQEQVKMAHQVAKLLMSEAAIQKSRGSKMFTKRRERAEKWVHEAKEDDKPKSQVLAPQAVTRKPPPEAFYKSLQPDSQIGVWNPMLAPPTAPPPPPVMAPPRPVSYHEMPDPKCGHTVVAPEKCFNLAAALHASKGRGGQIFAKRRAKSENWVVDESNVKSPPPPIVPTPAMRLKTGNKLRPEKSPWEEAMGAEAGLEFSANKRHTVGAEVFKNVPDLSQVRSIHDFKASKKDGPQFKDFNRQARGWGGGGPTPSRTPSSEDGRSYSRSSSVVSSEGDTDRRAPVKMAAGNRLSMGYDPRQPAVNRNDLTQALGARGFVAVGSSGASDL